MPPVAKTAIPAACAAIIVAETVVAAQPSPASAGARLGRAAFMTEPAVFAHTVRSALRDNDGLLAAARSLVGIANAAGGADNITVALVPVNTPDR